jgi:serine/threonine-protein kinase
VATGAITSPGARLDGGRFELLAPVGEGKTASIWVARVQGSYGFEKLFAVKAIHAHLADDAAVRTTLLDEARVVQRIRHRNVAELTYLGEDFGQLYMVFEWIDGDSWASLIRAIHERGDAVPVDVMLRIAADVSAGLEAAHELVDDAGESLAVVHRDASPANVMITTAGIAKVIDFGVARAKGRASKETREGFVKGTLEYLAPEVALKQPLDRRADVWAVGAALYHALMGRPPFSGKSPVDTMRQIVRGKPLPLPNRVPRAAADAIMEALEPDVSRRIPTARDFQRRLEAAMTAPVSEADVAAALRPYRQETIAARQELIARALSAARARAAEVLRETTRIETEKAPRAAEPAPPPLRVRRLRASQVAWATLATAMVTCVWSAVLTVAVHSHFDAVRERELSATGGAHAGL